MRRIRPLVVFIFAAALALGANVARAAELDCTSGTCTGGGSSPLIFGGITYADFAGALWTVSDSQSTGSGVIDSFVRISDNAEVVDGMNTSRRPLNQGDENSSPTFTHDIQGAQVPVVEIDGMTYYEFLLDINQQSSDPLLSLDGLELCIGSSGGEYTGGTCDTPGAGGTTLVYDLDATADNRLKLDYNLNAGSGSGDLFVYIPTIAGLTDDTYVYLWSQFGQHYGNNDGYEEWAVRTVNPISPVPEPGTIVLLGLGLAGVAVAARRRRLAA